MELNGVADLPEIRPGDDIAALVADRATLEPGDVLTVASTIVSKAEGRTADLEDYPVSGRAREIADRLESVAGEEKDPRFAQAIIEESSELLIDCPFLLAETRFGTSARTRGSTARTCPITTSCCCRSGRRRAPNGFDRGSQSAVSKTSR